MASPDKDRDSSVEEEAPFVSHLIELRDRLIRAIIGIAVVIIALFPFAQQIYTALALPLMRTLPGTGQMIAIEPAGPLITPLKLVVVLAIFVTMPWTLYQLWQFVAPGLYQRERRLAMPLLASSIVLFYAGVAFAYFVVFRLIFGFLTSIVPEGVTMTPDITKYLDFVLTLFFAFGVAFEVPIATILLVAVGATTPESLAQKRPYVIVGAFVIGMVLTPPDIISQTLLAIPMWALYELGIIFARITVTRPRERAEQAEAEPEAGTGQAGAAADPDAGAEETDDADEEYRPLSDDEMEAELDRLDEEERDEGESGDSEPTGDEDDESDPDKPPRDPGDR